MKIHGRASARVSVLLLAAIPLAIVGSGAFAATKEARTGAFIIEHVVTLPGTPAAMYDAMTGDIGGWWDHSFSDHPKRFFIEAKPGGGFWEYFDVAGRNGVKHATVIYADRGKLLRFEGPLGLSGNAVTFVTTWSYEPVGNDSTKLVATSHVAGEYDEKWLALVDQVEKHFIVERFKPYVESGEYKKKVGSGSRRP